MNLLALLLLSCLVYYLYMTLRSAWFFTRRQAPPAPEQWPALSVVVPARNEAARIGACIDAVLAQDYPASFELIVVDDDSEDETAAIAQRRAATDARLRVLQYRPPAGAIAGKKMALTAGIAAAVGEVIVQTDADCYAKPGWLRAIAAQFGPDTPMVAGPLQLLHDGSPFQALQALEAAGLAALGGGAMMAGRPHMCNGANLAYRKSAFEAVKGFEGAMQVASGDDELLLQKMHRRWPGSIRFAGEAAAIVYSHALHGWKAFKAQRLRWVSKARNYTDRRVNAVQLISYLGFCAFPALLIMAAREPRMAWLCAAAFIAKCLADLCLMYPAARFFHNLPLLRYFVLLEIVYIPYVLWVGIAGNFVKTYSWKNRTVR